MSAVELRINDSVESCELSVTSLDDSLDTELKATSLDTTQDLIDTSREETKSDEATVDYEREEGDGQEYESEDEEGELGSEGSDEGDDEEEEEGEGSIAPVKEKKLDDDEDRRNPQYIPKRGTFYEHDDRTADYDDGTPATGDKEADRGDKEGGGGADDKKKVWKEHESRWNHDMYNEDEQTPKTAEELIELYGYDIRNEEGPPRARRRRRYGRGPNKYTRNWEDEGAYNRPSGPPSVTSGRRDNQAGGGRRGERGRRDKEAFPALPKTDNGSAGRSPSPTRDDQPQITPTTTNTTSAWSRRETNRPAAHAPPAREEYPKLGGGGGGGGGNRPLQLTPPPERRVIEVIRAQNESRTPGREPIRHPREDNRHDAEPVRRSSGRGVVIRRVKPFESATLVNNGRGGREQGGGNRPRSGHPPGRLIEDSQDVRASEPAAFYSKKVDKVAGPKLRTQEDLANDLARMNLYANQRAASPEHEHSQHIPSREFTRRPEQANKNNMGYQQQQHQQQQQQHQPQQQQQQQQPERRQAVVPPRLQQDAAANRPKRYSSMRQRSLPETGAPLPAQQQAYPQPPQQHQFYQTSYVQQPLPPQQPPLQMMQAVHPPTTYAPTFNSPPAFIQPAPSAHMMRRPPSPGHYLPAPPPPQAVMGYVQQPYPAYQTFTTVAAPPPQPADLALYQPQGGITYYSPEEQMMTRALTSQQRRQRAAIPIVPPPERFSRGRGRNDGAGDGRQYSPGSEEGDGGRYEEDGGGDVPRGGHEGKYDDAETAAPHEGQVA